MACQIKRKEDGTISEVLAPNGKPSILYRDLVTTITNNEASVNAIRSDSYVSDIMSTEYIANNTVSELALAAWSKAYTSSFMDSFGYWNEEKLDNTDINGEPLLQELFPILKSAKETDVKQTIEAIASRMASRIGIRYTIIDDPNQDFKGRVDNSGAFINLAYATKDTPIHEIVAHPIIRAIKSKKITKVSEIPVNEFSFPEDVITVKVYKKRSFLGVSSWYYTATEPNWDENGKLVDTVIKKDIPIDNRTVLKYYQTAVAFTPNLPSQSKLYLNLLKELEYGTGKEVLDRIKRDYPFKLIFNRVKDKYEKSEITLAEQQEEAIVELLGMMTAQKLDEVKDKGLIAVLRQLLKEIKTFVLNLMRQKEIDIDNLPDNLTLNDISNIIAYSDNKLVLPGYKVEYTTPDNMKFETYQDASKHITKLVKDLKNVEPESKSLVDKIVDPITGKDIVSIYVNIGSPEQFVTDDDGGQYVIPEKESSVTLNFDDGTTKSYNESELPDAMFTMYMDDFYNKLRSKIEYEEFLDKNLEYEKSKLIVEDWKKANKITYNPNEVYSRGYEFVSVLGAYAKLDADLLLKNLIQHIEDNQKAGGEFVISAFTKKVDRKKSVLEGQGGKIKFKIYPQPNDIKWAADSDVYSGSVWDASKFVSQKQSELMGVSYTKYPKLDNLRRVKPNLAAALSDSEKIYNELGIALTGKNFRLAYDRDINADTKKLIDNINKLLDMKYGKLIPPSIIETTNFVNIPVLYENKEYKTIRSYSYENDMYRYYDITDGKETIKGLTSDKFVFKEHPRKGIEPKIKTKDIKKSILEIKNDYNAKSIYDLQRLSQINLNLKVAKLKEVGTKYPRALITSKLVLDEYEQQFTLYGLFQKIPSTVKPGVDSATFDKQLAQKIQDKLQKLYPEIKLNITNNPVWEKGNNIFNQNIDDEINNFELFEAQDKLCPTGICNYTAKVSTKHLQKIGLNPYPSNYNGSQLPVKVKSPIGDFNIEHYVSAVAINNAIYIYDMPQNEFISNEFFGRGSDVKVKESYKPRLIPLTIDEIKSNYNISTQEAGDFIHSIINNNGWGGADAAPSFRKYIENNIKNSQEYINLLESQIKDSGYEFKQWDVEEYRQEYNNKRQQKKLKKVSKKEEQKVINYYENKLKLKTKEYLPKKTDSFSLKTLINSVLGKDFEKNIDNSSFETALQSLDTYLKSEKFVEDLLDKVTNAEESLITINKSIDEVYTLARLFSSFTKNVKVYGIEEAIKKYDLKQQYTIRTLLPSNVLDKYKSKEQAALLLQKYWGNKDNIVKQLNIYKNKTFTDLVTNRFKAYSVFNKYQTVLNFLKSTDFDSSYLYQAISNEAVRRYSYFDKIGNTQFQKDEFNRIIGQANIKALTVLIDAVNQKQDTLPHEYAHHYISWYRNTPIVQEAIKKWGSEEALVQAIGEQVVKQKGEAYNWWNNFVRWILNQFNKLSTLQKEELTQILTDAFLTRQDLNTTQPIKPGVAELFVSNPLPTSTNWTEIKNNCHKLL